MQKSQLSDEELVLYALVGSLEAFDELVRRFRPAVIIVAEQVLRSRSAAEDVAQESFLLAFKALPQLQTPSKFAAWLCAITRHRARRAAAREARNVAAEPSELDRLLLTHSQELTVSPAQALMRVHTHDCLNAALEELPSEYRLPLQLRYYEEWPLGRIAGFLSLPLTTVKWRLHYGRQLLRRRLSEQEGDER